MQNRSLAYDYVSRAQKRIAALNALMKEESWADVVRESQEVVELALKALLRHSRIEVPRVHDVSEILIRERDQLPAAIHPELTELAAISKALRRDRELAFYGTEDLTPSEFYSREDAEDAFAKAQKVVALIKPLIPSP